MPLASDAAAVIDARALSRTLVIIGALPAACWHVYPS